jgi:hypothetical protein
MKTRHSFTRTQVALFNLLLDLNYSEPYITMQDIQRATGSSKHQLALVLGDLISKGKILAGNEEALGTMLHTYTPIVYRGQAYGYPLDEFTYEEWMQFAL